MANIEKEIDQTIISNERFDQLWSNNRKKANTPHKRLPPFLLLENHKVASSGNITVVSGAQKSGKSAFQGMIISKFLNPVPLYDTPALEVFPNTDKKAIIHIDTEQSEEDNIDFLRSITKRLDINELPDHFY